MTNINVDVNTIGGAAILRAKQLIAVLGISRSTAYARMNPASSQYDPNFPQPIRLSSASKRGAVGWLMRDVTSYINLCANLSQRDIAKADIQTSEAIK
jgi:prophage regulatory protein